MFRFASAAAAISVGLLVMAAGAANPPFGGDDTGFVPAPKSDTAKCELKASKATGKLVACIIKCHESRASGKLADDTAEDNCEKANDGKSCLAKYFKSTTTAIGKGGCPACAASNVSVIANTAESVLDGSAGLAYCASPSGAFVDGRLAY